MPFAAWEKASRAVVGMSRSMSSSSKPAMGMARREWTGRSWGKGVGMRVEVETLSLNYLFIADVSCCATAIGGKASAAIPAVAMLVQVSKTFNIVKKSRQHN
jgi:hypothetical protein